MLAIDGTSQPDELWAASALAIGVIATVLAALAADLVAHLTVHHAFPNRRELQEMLLIAVGGLSSAVLPLLILVAAVLGWLDIELALMIAAFVYVAALGALGFRAVRGAGLKRSQNLVAFLFFVAIALFVTIVEVIAHSH